MANTETTLPLNRLRSRLMFSHSVADLFFNKFRFFGSRAFSRLISKIILPPLNKKIICPTLYGFDILLNPRNSSDIYEIYNLGFYEAGTLDVLKKCLRKGDVFIDVGASIGTMSLYASKIIGNSGKVLAFEPTQKTYEELSASIAINQFTNISAYKMGLGNETKTIPIYTNRSCPSMVELNPNDPHEIVEIDRLDNVLTKASVSGVRMIKIDVEGFELEVLRGSEKLLSSKDAPIICLEYMKSLIRSSEDDAISYLRRVNSYRFYQLERSKNSISKLCLLENENEFRNDDNIFCLLEGHIATVPQDLFKVL